MMKNIFMSAMVLALALMVGCSKDETPEQTIKYKVNFEVAERSQDGTRAIKQSWERDDQILIVFNDGTNWFDCLNNANTIKLTYDGSEWNADVDNMPQGLQGGKYTACHHMGDVFLGANGTWSGSFVFSQYNGGEFLYSQKSEYTVNGDVIDLGTIKMQRNQNDFQISVTGLTGKDWNLSITNPNNSNDQSIRHLQRSVYYVKKDGATSFLARTSEAAGVEYKDGVIFYFSRNISQPLSGTRIFTLTNGTDTYTYTKTGVTSTTLEGGKAYSLPAEKFGITSNN